MRQAPCRHRDDVHRLRGVADGTYTYQVVARRADDTTLGVASAAVTVVYDTTAPAAPGGVTRHRGARRLGQRSPGRPRATAPARASRATSCAASLSLERARLGRRRRRDLPGPGDVLRRRDDAQRQALQLRRVRRRRASATRRRPAVSPAVTARDQLAPAVPRASRRRRATRSVDLRWARRRRRRRRRRLRARGQAGQRGAGQRDRRHARLHARSSAGVDRVLGDRAHERRDVHVRSLRARRGAQPLAGRRRQRGAERQGDRRRRRRRPSRS